MFKITRGSGFHIRFENGYTVSVQFGPGNYAGNYNRDYDEQIQAGSDGSNTAECAVWELNGSLIPHESFNGDTVGAHKTPEEVLELLNWAASQPNKEA